MHRFVASGFYAGLIPQRLWGSDNGAGTFGAAVAVDVLDCLQAADRLIDERSSWAPPVTDLLEDRGQAVDVR